MEIQKGINTKLYQGLLINNRYKLGNEIAIGDDYEMWNVFEKNDTESESYRGGLAIQLYDTKYIEDRYLYKHDTVISDAGSYRFHLTSGGATAVSDPIIVEVVEN